MSFDLAVFFISNYDGPNKLSMTNADKLKFYGLYKLATAGPCTTTQPSRFSVEAHAKWTAWNELGSMTPEVRVYFYVLQTIIYFCRTQ